MNYITDNKVWTKRHVVTWYSHDFMYSKFIGACETLGAVLATKLAFAMKCPDVLPNVRVFCKALRKKIKDY